MNTDELVAEYVVAIMESDDKTYDQRLHLLGGYLDALQDLDMIDFAAACDYVELYRDDICQSMK